MRRWVHYALAVVLLISCKKNGDPVFPIEPYLEFRSIEFVDSGNPNELDTLKISFYFRDGDFDLGLTPADTNAPYNREYYFLHSRGSRIPDTQVHQGVFSTSDLITFADQRAMKPDTLPGFVPPYSCTRWEVFHKVYFIATDTVYYQINQNYFNIYPNILIVNPDGSITPFDFSQRFVYPDCYPSGFFGRFPAPANLTSTPDPYPYKVTMLSSREGVMTYSMASAGWKASLGGMKIKLDLMIRDRALHASNVIESTDVQF